MTRLLDWVEIKTAAVEQTFPVQDELSEAEIRDGISAGALRLVYQPKVDALTLDLVGAEALLRWETPDGRRLGPGAVIPVAERSDLMQSLTRAVFSMAMTQLRDWQQLGHRWKLSCNFSINDLMQPEVVADLERIISQAEAPADLVILEVSESKIAEDVASVLSALTRLRLKGFGISIDDFGTGFSSMEQLRKFPFTELKIDRAFVAGAQQKPSARAIFESSVNLAKLLGISSVAEGAEDAEDLALCRELGVDLIQGYFIAKPMPPEEFLAWALKRGH
ncbi:MAG: EAL domain-containing protein [Gammaproteobacteria bacterium TMED182]|nr:MAG: EAL domain-containing protein [Gammaproteobacteria bacterium TMED182]